MSKRTIRDFGLEDADIFKHQCLHWLLEFEHAAVFDSNGYKRDRYASFDYLAAAGAQEVLTADINCLGQLRSFINEHQDWTIGHISYDLKNEIEELGSDNVDDVGFPLISFFIPETLIEVHKNTAVIHSIHDPGEIFNEITRIAIRYDEENSVEMESRTNREDYIETVKRMRNDISEGDYYEMNYCREFHGKGNIDPAEVFYKLNKQDRSPFSAFYRCNDHYLMSASPERFLKRIGDKLISQPIKGTIKRSDDAELDKGQVQRLHEDEKERAENVMIVDLVRNDLAKISKTGSVKVEELFGIYTFKHVHQMISTVSSTLLPERDIVDILKATFPMGSMTGAPKVEVMKRIEAYEDFRRGLYSGSVGYITPTGDFDFNVIIRSIQYNDDTGYVSCKVGGAITYDSDPEREYEETLLKVKGMLAVLKNNVI